ncbi:NAD-dependent epimerase/dehydratase family protein [Jannaschia ovalis]|uniref:NAD-dependent epimerase/dehydratase family protein n=1 Tax=Jannaschia ovalis TaxID=3038773 RepID=A0ABY8L889_9RHOB|nr:NAD-dependent epimerase/dehydratase family protein [Jannaschia sp. GRR-S6-38]WGH77296.1 NAD-dependent epimerase/dehydratase family protein [Jannaschia sp. GRR-S6-38]
MAETRTAPRHALVTGSAGFIGHHVAARLLDDGWRVTGLDAMSDYYDPALKRARNARLEPRDGFAWVEGRLEDPDAFARAWGAGPFDAVIHLAAQAGVRHSIEAPGDYVDANLRGTFALLEAARHRPPAHLLLASTSSVYGANTAMPYREIDRADHQMSFYAATKKATEAMAHSYAHLYGLPTTMFRFFTVYGPWGRPDMAPSLFTSAIFEGRPIKLFNGGDMRRDFTFVGDLVERLVALIDVPPGDAPAGDFDSLSPVAPHRIVNIGTGRPTELAEFVASIERAAGRAALREMHPMQPGDVPATWADTTLQDALIGPRQVTPLQTGIDRFVDWFRDYHGA